jgi:hypothetical protein
MGDTPHRRLRLMMVVQFAIRHRLSAIGDLPFTRSGRTNLLPRAAYPT